MRVMRFLANLVVYLLALGFGIGALVLLSWYCAGLSVPVSFALVLAFLLARTSWIANRGVATTLAWATGSSVCWGWFLTSNVVVRHLDYRSLPALLLGSLALLTTCIAIVSVLRVPSKQRGPVWKLLIPLALAVLISIVSSSVGASDPMKDWVIEHLKMSPETAQAFVHYLRKTIHFTFYGLVAWSAAVAARSAKEPVGSWLSFGLMFAVSVAAMDELRQMTTAGRTGSFWDVLLDVSGAVVFLSLAVWRGRSKARPSQKQSASPSTSKS